MEIYDIACSIKNRNNQEFKIETDGDGIILSVIEDKKVCKFEIKYNNLMALEDIKNGLTKCSGHITKNRAYMSRKNNES